MNKYIEIVEKWLADNSSVTSEELKANLDAAHAASAVSAAAYATAYKASYYAHKNDADCAEKWLNEYKEVTGR